MKLPKDKPFKTYISAKLVVATPHEKDGKAGYKVIYPGGYESWCPKDVFDAQYREVDRDIRDLKTRKY